MRDLLQWAEPDTYGWPPGHMEWLCRCGEEISVVWRANCSLYDNDDPIKPEDANSDWWHVECHGGHVLLLCHELADDESGDTFPPPTTSDIVERLASAEDVAAWRASWKSQGPPA